MTLNGPGVGFIDGAGRVPTRCPTTVASLTSVVGHSQLEGLAEGQAHRPVDVLHLGLHLLPVLRAVAELHCVGFGWWVRRASVVEREATVAEDLGREREGGTYA